MAYGKQIVILSGAGVRVVLTVETRDGKSSGRLSAPITGNRVYLAVRQGEQKCAMPLSGSTVDFPFEINQNAHFTVVSAADMSLIAYGSASSKRLWRGNMLDGVKEIIEEMEKHSAESSAKVENTEKAVLSAAERTAAEAETVDYDDFAIADNNYYPEEYGRDVTVKRGDSSFQHAGYFKGREVKRVAATAAENEASVSTRKSLRAMASDRTNAPRMQAVSYGEGVNAVSVGAKEQRSAPYVGVRYYERVAEKIEKLLSVGEPQKELERRIPGSRWVRVQYDKKSYYTVGIIGSPPEFICYGAPGVRFGGAPSELGSDVRWMPDDPAYPDGKGLWLICQCALSGESVRSKSTAEAKN